MVIAKRPSKITLPAENNGWENLLAFLVTQFPLIEKDIWLSRFEQGKIHWLNGEPLDASTKFVPSKILCYYREVPDEPKIPFEHQILYQDAHILVACKPHFLPVTPGGVYVNECLLERIRQQQNLPDIVPMHRLDRETAGLVLFSINSKTRGIYCQLFAEGKISKRYLAVARLSSDSSRTGFPQGWEISNRLEKSLPRFTMREVEGKNNAHSKIKLVNKSKDLGLFELNPITGKTHQLRLHMQKIGMPILNDKFYPTLLAKQPLRFEDPLQLLAKRIVFKDPLTARKFEFESSRQLDCFVE